MSERTKAGIQTSQKKGTYVAGPTPFGYKRDKKAHTLVVQESQAETVRKIFAWYADGINGTEIAQTLTQEAHRINPECHNGARVRFSQSPRIRFIKGI